MIGSNCECSYSQNFRKRLLDFINFICFVGYYLRRDKLVGLLTTHQLEQLQREVANLSDLNFSSLNFCSKETATEFLEKELKKRKKEEY